jgi:hypothetical protein
MPASLNNAAEARNDSRWGRAGYPDQVSPAGVAEHAGLRAKFRAVPDRVMARYAHLPGEEAPVADARRPGNPHLGHDQAQLPDLHVVRHLHEVVDLGAGADHGVIDAATIDGGVGADLDVVVDDATADVRDLRCALAKTYPYPSPPMRTPACAMTRFPSTDRNTASRGEQVTTGADRDAIADHDMRVDD